MAVKKAKRTGDLNTIAKMIVDKATSDKDKTEDKNPSPKVKAAKGS